MELARCTKVSSASLGTLCCVSPHQELDGSLGCRIPPHGQRKELFGTEARQEAMGSHLVPKYPPKTMVCNKVKKRHLSVTKKVSQKLLSIFFELEIFYFVYKANFCKEKLQFCAMSSSVHTSFPKGILLVS